MTTIYDEEYIREMGKVSEQLARVKLAIRARSTTLKYDMPDLNVPCHSCGTCSAYALERHERGDTPLCYACTVASNNGRDIQKVECSCSSRELFAFGCQCNYAKRKKEKNT